MAKSVNELEREAYIAGAVVTADLYATIIDKHTADSECVKALEQELDDRLLELEELYEDYDETNRENYELRGRLEEAEWRLLDLEK